MAKLTGTGVSGSDIFCTARVKSYPGVAVRPWSAIRPSLAAPAGRPARVPGARSPGPRTAATTWPAPSAAPEPRCGTSPCAPLPVVRHPHPRPGPGEPLRCPGGHPAPQPLVGQPGQAEGPGLRPGAGAAQGRGYPLPRLLQRRAGGQGQRNCLPCPARKPPGGPGAPASGPNGWRTGKPVYNLPGWSWGFTTAIELYGEYDRAVSYVCKYIGKELAPSPNGDGLEPQKIGGRWYYSGGALGRPQVTYAELDFRQAEQEPGAYRFDLPQAGISFVQFQFQAKGGENSGEPVEKVAGGQSEVPLVGAVRQPPLLGLRPGLRGARAAAREAALERLFDAMEEQWEQEALDYWL